MITPTIANLSVNFTEQSTTLKDLTPISMNESITMSTIEAKATESLSITTDPSLDHSEIYDAGNVLETHPGIKFQVLSIATVAAFMFISNIGWVALNQVICAEFLPREIHRSANTLIVSFSFVSAFISIKMFADLVQYLDAGHTFYLFGGICLFATIFTLLFVPETSHS
jgi:hypothetical protein